MHFKLCFQRANRSRTGIVDVVELGEWTQSIGLHGVSFETLQSMVEQIDLSNKGGVDFFEFLGVQLFQSFGIAYRNVPVRDFVRAVARTTYADGLNGFYV